MTEAGLQSPPMGYALTQWCLRRRHAQRDMVFRGARRSGTTFPSLASEHRDEVRSERPPMKIALVAQNATPLHPRSGSGPDRDDIGLSELTRKLAGQGHQVTVYAQKNAADLPDQAELHAGVRVEHIDSGPVAETCTEPGDADLLERVPAFSGPLRSLWQSDRPDVVHALHWTSGLAALAAARDLGIPVVQEFSSLGVTERRAAGLGRRPGGGPAGRAAPA